MKRTAAIVAGLTMVGGAAIAAPQETATQDPTDSSIVTEDERHDRTGMESDTQGEYGTSTQATDPYSSDTQSSGQHQTEMDTQTETQTQDPVQTIPESEQTYGAQSGQAGQDVSQMSHEELSGRTVMTADGEEIGQIEQVGYSSTYQEQVATVNVGGFLGVGEKLIAIPMSRLEMGSDDSLQTTMDRQEIEAAQEFDPSNLSTEQQQQQDW